MHSDLIMHGASAEKFNVAITDSQPAAALISIVLLRHQALSPLRRLGLLNPTLLPFRFRHQKMAVEFSQRLDVDHGTFTGGKQYEFGSA